MQSSYPLALGFGVSLLLLLLACTSPTGTAQPAGAATAGDPEAVAARLDSLERAIFPDGLTETVDTALAHPYVRLVEHFAHTFPDHARAPHYLMQGAGLANGSEWGNKAIELWGYVWRRYPDYERAPLAMFYQGFVMDTRYGDYPLATRYYDRFLEHFPEHELVEQVRQLRAVSARGGTLPPVPTPPGN